MHHMTLERSTTTPQSTNRSQGKALGPMVAFDVAAPLATYYLLRADGLSSVVALVVSGVFPFAWVSFGFVLSRRFDAVGGLVLAGIVAGVILGLASGNGRLVVIEGSVPTGVFGLYFLGSLLSQRPMMFRFPLQAMGADTPKGRAFAERWRFTGFRRACRIMTAVWGVGFLATAAATVLIAETTSTDTANGTTTGLSVAVVTVLIAWTITYSKRRQRESERRGGADARNDGGRHPAGTAPVPGTGASRPFV